MYHVVQDSLHFIERFAKALGNSFCGFWDGPDLQGHFGFFRSEYFLQNLQFDSALCRGITIGKLIQFGCHSRYLCPIGTMNLRMCNYFHPSKHNHLELHKYFLH